MSVAHQAFCSQLLRYVGVGLISGSIVHMSTLGGNLWQYAVLIIAGATAFVLGTFLEHTADDPLPLPYLGLSVLFSLGIGMVSGAIQHYLDGPHFAAVLIALGLFLGYLAFFLRDYRGEMTMQRLAILATTTILIGVALFGIAEALPHTHQSGHEH